MNKKYKLLLLLAFSLPSITLLFDLNFGIIIAPFLFIATLISGGILYYILSFFKLNPKLRVKIIFIISVLLSIWNGHGIQYHYSDEGVFTRYVSPLVPEGIEYVDNRGTVGFAGGYKVLVFRLQPGEFDLMMSQSDFKRIDPSEFRDEVNEPTHDIHKYNLSPAYYYRVVHIEYNGHILSEKILITNKEKNLVYVNRNKI